MNILNVVSGLQRASGVSVFVEEMARELIRRGHVVRIATSSNQLDLVEWADVVHIHGLWTPVLHRACRVARTLERPVVWSPHGMLQKWALRNKWPKKVLALGLYQWWDLRAARLLHATAQCEVEDIRRIGLKNRIVVAPLGVREPPAVKSDVPVGNAEFRTLLFVSRVQRKKGLPNLLTAWSLLPERSRSGWRIRIVGPDQERHTDELRTLAAQLAIEDQVIFVGPRYADDLEFEYNHADAFVLPTHSENFGSVVIEALAHGVPVICTKAAPWEELETNRCGWWVEDSLEAIRHALGEMIDCVQDLRDMGERGRRLVREKYTWYNVAQTMEVGYYEAVHKDC